MKAGGDIRRILHQAVAIEKGGLSPQQRTRRLQRSMWAASSLALAVDAIVKVRRDLPVDAPGGELVLLGGVLVTWRVRQVRTAWPSSLRMLMLPKGMRMGVSRVFAAMVVSIVAWEGGVQSWEIRVAAFGMLSVINLCEAARSSAPRF
ncbi:MAG: hypothetical protein ACP5G7_07820 [Anaerolineae bacterium]